MSVCVSGDSAGRGEVLIKYTGKYVKIYFRRKIAFLHYKFYVIFIVYMLPYDSMESNCLFPVAQVRTCSKIIRIPWQSDCCPPCSEGVRLQQVKRVTRFKVWESHMPVYYMLLPYLLSVWQTVMSTHGYGYRREPIW